MDDVVMNANRARKLAREKNSVNRVALKSLNDFDNLGQFIQLCAMNSNYSLTIVYDFTNGMPQEKYDSLITGLTISGFKVRRLYNDVGSSSFDLLISW